MQWANLTIRFWKYVLFQFRGPCFFSGASKFSTRRVNFKGNIPGQPVPFRHIHLWFSSLRMRGLLVRVGSIFIPFIPSRSIEAYKRSQGQSERGDTLICQCRLCCCAPLSPAYPRVPVLRARLFSTFRLFCSITRCGKIHRGLRKRKRERERRREQDKYRVGRERERRKQELPPI